LCALRRLAVHDDLGAEALGHVGQRAHGCIQLCLGARRRMAALGGRRIRDRPRLHQSHTRLRRLQPASRLLGRAAHCSEL
jgi:hypothetical protein